jgi:DNA mismatch endonuclease (patch repair protein)
MQANRSRDTGPELSLRRELHRQGYRYLVNRAPVHGLRRTADLVFPRAKVAVFVDGCFWHGCPQHHTKSKTNAPYWAAKVEQNRARDRDTDSRLESSGWRVVRLWEHEATDAAVRAVIVALDQAREPAPTTPLGFGTGG